MGYKFKDYKDLTFADDFLFCKIMQSNIHICKRVTEIILDREIKEIVQNPSTQETVRILPDRKSVRFDVCFTDDEGTVYDIEMQTSERQNLALRARYYQSMIDLSSLKAGESYQKLKPSCIIFICLFDPFGKGLSRYTIESRCAEMPSLAIEDKSKKVFVWPGQSRESLPEDLRAFLGFLNGELEENHFVMELMQAVREAKNFDPWNVEYMSMMAREWDRYYEGHAEGRAEGELSKEIQTVRQAISDGHSFDTIAAFLHMPLNKVIQLSKMNPPDMNAQFNGKNGLQ